MTEIRLEHVSYAYGDEKILEDINLQVTSGEVVFILGPSGVGKPSRSWPSICPGPVIL